MIKTFSDLMMSPPGISEKVKEIIETSEKNLKLVCDDGEVWVNKEFFRKRSAYCDTLCQSGFMEIQSQGIFGDIFGDGPMKINPFRPFCTRFSRLRDSTCAVLFDEKNCQSSFWTNDTFNIKGGFTVPDTMGKLMFLPEEWEENVESLIGNVQLSSSRRSFCTLGGVFKKCVFTFHLAAICLQTIRSSKSS